MDHVWTNVDLFCPYFTNLFAAVAETHLILSFKANFFLLDPDGFSMDDTRHHIRQRKSRLKPLSLSTNIYMPFHYILHFLSQNNQPWFLS